MTRGHCPIQGLCQLVLLHLSSKCKNLPVTDQTGSSSSFFFIFMIRFSQSQTVNDFLF